MGNVRDYGKARKIDRGVVNAPQEGVQYPAEQTNSRQTSSQYQVVALYQQQAGDFPSTLPQVA